MKRNSFLLLLTAGFIALIVCLGPRGASAIEREPQVSKPTEVKIDPKTFDRFVGQYSFADNPDLVLSFFREGNKFFIQATNQGRIEIFPMSETKFFLKVIDAEATFVRDAQGKVTSVLWRQSGQTTPARKTSDQPAVEPNVEFERREEMIRTRDGVRLHTVIFIPKGQTEALPILIDRTPYGVGQSNSDGVNRRYRDLVNDGYIFVYQDIRGRYGSEGTFLMNRPMHDKKDPKGIDESTDTYDTIDWLIKNVPKDNGRA